MKKPGRYLRIKLGHTNKADQCSVTDFEGFTDPEKALDVAHYVWESISHDSPEKDPNLWTVWVHWVHRALEEGDYDVSFLPVKSGPVPLSLDPKADEALSLFLEVLVALQMFLGRDRGVFLRPDVKEAK